MDDSVPQAERINVDKNGKAFLIGSVRSGGVPPKPIRKRANWRAFRRGEHTAIVSMGLVNTLKGSNQIGICRFKEILADRNCPDGRCYTFWL